MSFTQSELDEVLNRMFNNEDGIVELVCTHGEWNAWINNPGQIPFKGATPAEAIRAAVAGVVAVRLTK
jgi:hypothetical protein